MQSISFGNLKAGLDPSKTVSSRKTNEWFFFNGGNIIKVLSDISKPLA